MQEMLIAVLGKDINVDPLPFGQHLTLLPKCFPSHPKGQAIEPQFGGPLHASEQGLPWKQLDQRRLAQKAEDEKTAWGWPRFFNFIA